VLSFKRQSIKIKISRSLINLLAAFWPRYDLLATRKDSPLQRSKAIIRILGRGRDGGDGVGGGEVRDHRVKPKPLGAAGERV
jgi:hypothetical protein